MSKNNIISIVIPCYNEAQIIEETAQVVSDSTRDLNYNREIIFVNDGSSDDTLTKLVNIAAKNPLVKYISFSRNFGKESAMLAGLKAAHGECVVLMDADLQHSPSFISNMIKKYEEGYDQVIAKRTRTGDSKLKTVFARSYYKLINKMVDVKMVDGAGDFRLMSRRVVNALVNLQETNRFSKGLYSWIGYKTIYLDYENQDRIGGESKWSLKQLLSYGIDGVLSFNNKPLRVCIYLGFTLVLIGLIYLIYLFVSILRNGIDVPGYFTTILLITCLGGVQLLSLGVIGEYVGRIYSEVKRRPGYLIDKTNIEDINETENI